MTSDTATPTRTDLGRYVNTNGLLSAESAVIDTPVQTADVFASVTGQMSRSTFESGAILR